MAAYGVLSGLALAFNLFVVLISTMVSDKSLRHGLLRAVCNFQPVAAAVLIQCLLISANLSPPLTSLLDECKADDPA